MQAGCLKIIRTSVAGGYKELFAMSCSNPGSEGTQACEDKALYIGNLHSSVSLDVLQVCIL